MASHTSFSSSPLWCNFLPLVSVELTRPNSCHAGQAKEDPRSKGYTVVAYTVFASLDDMKYYDTDCAAHAKLKKVAVEIVEEFPLVVYQEVEGGLPN